MEHQANTELLEVSGKLYIYLARCQFAEGAAVLSRDVKF